MCTCINLSQAYDTSVEKTARFHLGTEVNLQDFFSVYSHNGPCRLVNHRFRHRLQLIHHDNDLFKYPFELLCVHQF